MTLMERQKNLVKISNLTRLIISVLTMLAPMLLLLSTVSITPFVIKSYGEDSLEIDTVQYKVDKSDLKKAPEFTQIEEYINTDPLRISELNGKVILVHFWTYSCINCIHTIPYLNEWYQKYSDKGLVIIGIHTPEFEFEKNIDNVREAVKEHMIEYPVLQDNNYATWNAFQNIYWPRDYVIDKEGFIRYDHIGEGGYNETENVIATLLEEPT
jgi:thiol-disulfide isomerase/thioredoxin